MLTNVIKSNNLMAVSIPQEMSFGPDVQEVDIERKGDLLIIRKIHRASLKDVANAFAAFPVGFMAEGREFNEQGKRNWK
jgi:virulence-associated protein VagC